jgi:hypothetical protein
VPESLALVLSLLALAAALAAAVSRRPWLPDPAARGGWRRAARGGRDDQLASGLDDCTAAALAHSHRLD